MRRIPRAFRLMGHRITVRVVNRRDWKHPGALGLWEPDKGQILLLRQPRTMLRHTLWHEITHAMLDMMSHRLSSNEAFVDQLGGLLAQINDTAEH